MAAQFTASRTIFEMEAGPITLTLEFLSPMTPDDLIRQSLPFSYLSITAVSSDGGEHDVKIYTDIDARFISNDWKAQSRWNTAISSGLVYHQASLLHQTTYGEFDDL